MGLETDSARSSMVPEARAIQSRVFLLMAIHTEARGVVSLEHGTGTPETICNLPLFYFIEQ